MLLRNCRYGSPAARLAGSLEFCVYRCNCLASASGREAESSEARAIVISISVVSAFVLHVRIKESVGADLCARQLAD